jgi:nucleolar protein 14
VIDDYDDDDLNKGRLNSEHFFGGFKSANDTRKPQTKQEWIEDMIKSTKLDKYERQRENEKVFDMTETLDEQWKALSVLMGIKEKKPKETKETADDYDKLVNSLKFEAKTTVC